MDSQGEKIWEEWWEDWILYSLFRYIKERRKYQLGCNHGLGRVRRYLDKNDTNWLVLTKGTKISYGYLSVEGIGVDGIGMCNLEVVSEKGGTYWIFTVGQHEESPDSMGKYLWIWSVGNGGHHFCKGKVKRSQIQRVPLRGRGLKSWCDYIGYGCDWSRNTILE